MELFAQTGLPEIIISDNGMEFVNKELTDWMSQNGIQHYTTSPYHSQVNDGVEWLKGILQKLLLSLSTSQPCQWSKVIPEALYVYQTSAGPSGIYPYEDVYGQWPRYPHPQMPIECNGEHLQWRQEVEAYLWEFREKSLPKRETSLSQTELFAAMSFPFHKN